MTAAVLHILPKRKGRPRPEDGRESLQMFPIGRVNRAFIYAIAFEGVAGPRVTAKAAA